MATYKVIQDIEAEDKLLGPLTLKQFIYALIVLACGFIAFKLATVAWYLAIPFIPPMLVFGVLAAPLGRDQPTEVWLLAKLRFFLKPKKRIWDQSGQLDYVTVTVPKRIDPSTFTDNLSEAEVKSRLKALSNTIDSRGWAVKNVDVNLYSQPNPYSRLPAVNTDRLVQLPEPPKIEQSAYVKPDEDMLDEENNPVAQQLDHMISASTQTHRQETLKKMQQIREHMAQVKSAKPDSGDSAGTWFMNNQPSAAQQSKGAVFSHNFSANTTAPKPEPTEKEQELLARARDRQSQQNAAYAHMPTIAPQGPAQAQSASPTGGNPAILGLANNDDLSVSTIARQASNQGGLDDSEVTVSLR